MSIKKTEQKVSAETGEGYQGHFEPNEVQRAGALKEMMYAVPVLDPGLCIQDLLWHT